MTERDYSDIPSIYKSNSYMIKIVEGEEALNDETYFNNSNLSSTFKLLDLSKDIQIFNGSNAE